MTLETVQYDLQDQVATVRIDDDKRNALSPQVLREINQALDRAESDRANATADVSLGALRRSVRSE